MSPRSRDSSSPLASVMPSCHLLAFSFVCYSLRKAAFRLCALISVASFVWHFSATLQRKDSGRERQQGQRAAVCPAGCTYEPTGPSSSPSSPILLCALEQAISALRDSVLLCSLRVCLPGLLQKLEQPLAQGLCRLLFHFFPAPHHEKSQRSNNHGQFSDMVTQVSKEGTHPPLLGRCRRGGSLNSFLRHAP